MANELIYIIEDEMIAADDLKNNLEDFGYIITGIVPDAEKAIEELAQIHSDIVLVDITLSGEMDGIEAASVIKKQFDIPVIYTTASSDDPTMSKAKMTEPFAYIVKPIDKKELHFAIEIALYRHHMDRKLRQSEQKFRNLVELAYDGILIVFGGVIKYANPKFLELCGETAENTRNTPLHEYMHPDNIKEEAMRSIRKQSGEKPVPIYKTVIKKRNGDFVDVEVSESEITYEGNDAGLIIIRDISNRKPRG
ncbi:MAG: response regulator [bacterium]|nr:response regulator [bacterium]